MPVLSNFKSLCRTAGLADDVRRNRRMPRCLIFAALLDCYLEASYRDGISLLVRPKDSRMIRTTVASAVMVGSLLIGTAAIAQSAAPQAQKRLTLSERLAEPVTFEYQKVPLKEAIEDLKEKSLIPIVLDTKKMEECAISLEIPISGKSSGAPAIDDINKLLRGVGLSGEMRLDILYISPLKGQKEFYICRLYRLPKNASAAELVKRITSKIAAETWRDAGGPGEIVTVTPTVIAISHTPASHREIERKLGKELSSVSAPLEQIAALAPTKGPNPLAAISQALRRTNFADYAETPCREALNDWAKNAKVKLLFDAPSLKAAGIHPGKPLTVNFKSMPADSVLTLMLEGFGLAWTLEGDQILITTPQVAAAKELTVTYDTRDLVPPSDNETLVRALQRTIRPANWDNLGRITAAEGNLKIKQTVQAHRLIETWLADLRTTLKPTPAK
jgi:hypothetical protein